MRSCPQNFQAKIAPRRRWTQAYHIFADDMDGDTLKWRMSDQGGKFCSSDGFNKEIIVLEGAT